MSFVRFPNTNMCPYLQINRYAFSGGQDLIEKLRQLGANLELLRFFFIPCANIYEGDSLVRSCKPWVPKDFSPIVCMIICCKCSLLTLLRIIKKIYIYTQNGNCYHLFLPVN